MQVKNHSEKSSASRFILLPRLRDRHPLGKALPISKSNEWPAKSQLQALEKAMATPAGRKAYAEEKNALLTRAMHLQGTLA
jgi:hypothetical protein